MTRPLLRELVAYPPDGDEPLEFTRFDDGLIDELRPLFDVGDDLDMVHVYAVTDGVRDRVARVLGLELRNGREFYIESSA